MECDTIKNIFSFGAHGRVQNALKTLREIEEELQRAHLEREQQRKCTNACLERLVGTKLLAVQRLRLLRKISKNLGVRERKLTEGSVGNVELGTPLISIENTLGAAEIAANLAKGTSVGVSTALGTWALVGTFGSASTGTAIGTLSGVAASNATLAWLGGGALAAGGGGMAAGTVVLGGIVLIPVLAILGIFSHVRANRKIAEIEEAALKATERIATYKKTLLLLVALQRRGDEINRTLKRSADVFERECTSASRSLFPWGIFSRMKRMIGRIFGMPFFSLRDIGIIAPLL